MGIGHQNPNDIEVFIGQKAGTLSFEYKWTTGIRSVGIDIVPVHRIAGLVDRYDCTTLDFLFTPREIDFCQSANNPDQFYTICFAAKEAMGKALGTGLVGIGWTQIESSFAHGELSIYLYGEARTQAKRRGIREWLANWFHWDDHVLVHIIAQ